MAVVNSRVLFVRHASTPATREAAFPADEPLDVHGRAAARCLHGLAPDHVVVSPLQRCRQTAEMAGWAVDRVDPRWAELDFGAWAGHAYGEVAATAADALAAWQADPVHVPPPGGETVTELAARVVDGLDDLHDRPGTTVVVTSGGPIKVLVLHALAAPLAALWNVEVAPVSVTELRAGPDGRWTLVVGARMSASAAPAVGV